MAALRLLRRHLLYCPECACAQGSDVLLPTPLSRLHDLLPKREWASKHFSDDDAVPLRSCFQWLFHPDCDVLNFSPPGDAAANMAIGVGADGNPEYVPGYRRMWVSGSVRFIRPFYPHDIVDKSTTVVAVVEKPTRSQGNIIFVERRSLMSARPGQAPSSSSSSSSSSLKGLAGSLTETTTHAFLPPEKNKNTVTLGSSSDSAESISFKDDPFRLPDPKSDRFPAPPVACLLTETIDNIDTSLLFKYSALTFNAHKIHYDLEHATNVEGYPGLVVHGPLLASFLLDAYQNWCHSGKELQHNAFSGFEFRYRGKAPLFLGSKLHLVAWQRLACNQSGVVEMAARDDFGRTVMEASVTRIS